MENNNQDQIQEIMEFLKDNMVTKDEFREELVKMATKEDLVKLGSRMDNLESRMATKDDLADLEGKLKTTMVSKSYLDDKLADAVADISNLIYRKDKEVKEFHKEVINIFEKNSLCDTEKIEELKQMV